MSAHIDKKRLMRQLVHHGRDQYLVLDDFIPPVKKQVCGNDCGFLSWPG